MDAMNGNANADLEQKRREATLKEIKRLQGVNSRLRSVIIMLVILFVLSIGGGGYMASQGMLPVGSTGVDTVEVVQHDTVYMSADPSGQDIVDNTMIEQTFYAIQIGYYKKLTQIIPIKAQSDLEVKEREGAKIFTLAKFNTYQEAFACKRLIKKVGFKDAFIVHYVDGKRVPIN